LHDGQGCQIFSWYNLPKSGKKIPNDHKLPNGQNMYQMAANIPNGHKVRQKVSFQGTPQIN
jgi:hypothetical protein